MGAGNTRPYATSGEGRDFSPAKGSPLSEGANLSELWARQHPDVGAMSSGRQTVFQPALPRQQIQRDQIEARRVAHLFEHLEHIDDELPLAARGVMQSDAPHKRHVKGALLPGLVLAAAGAFLPRLEPLTQDHHPIFDFDSTTFLLHTAAGFLTYATAGPLLRLLSLLVLRFSRLRGFRRTAQAVYLNGIFLREERVACAIFCLWAVNFSWWSSPTVTRQLLSRPCQAVLLLIIANGVRKLLEFAFLTRRLRDRFQSDVLANAYERAALQRLAAVASECASEGQAASASALQCMQVLPDASEPHAFERHTAEMLKTAFGLRDGKKTREVLGRRASSDSTSRAASKNSLSAEARSASRGSRLDLEAGHPVGPRRGRSVSTFKTPSTTVFVMQRDETCAEMEEEARTLFWQLVRRPWSSTGLPPPDVHDACAGRALDSRWEVLEMSDSALLRSDLGQAMPAEDADRTWQLLGARVSPEGRDIVRVCEDEFVQAFRGTFERFHMLAATLKDNAAIWLVFSNLLMSVQVAISVCVVLAIFVPSNSLRTLTLSIPTVFLAFSFVFESILREVLESLVLLLLMQPYDVGDRISVPDGEDSRILTVQKINILTTEARDSANKCVYLRNSALYQEPHLMNLGRSLNAVVELSVEISTSDLSNEVVRKLEEFIRRYISYKAVNWVPTYLRSFVAVEDGYTHCDLAGSVPYRFRLMHRKPWQNIREIRDDGTRVLYALLEEMQRIGLDFRLTSQPVKIEGARKAQAVKCANALTVPGSARSSGVNGMADMDGVAGLINTPRVSLLEVHATSPLPRKSF